MSIGGIMKKFLALVAIAFLTAVLTPISASADDSQMNYSSLVISSGSSPEVLELSAGGVTAITRLSEPTSSEKSVVKNRQLEYAVLDESLVDTTSGFSIASVASANSVELVWTNPHELEFHIFRNGVEVAVSDGTFFIDDQAVAGAQIEYQLTSIGNAVPNVLDPLEVTSKLLVTSPSNTSQTSVAMTIAQAAALPSYSYIRYQGFIQEAYVPVPTVGCEYLNPVGTNFFEGDSHLWSTTATKNRVAVSGSINWSTLALSSSTQIGETVIWNINSATGAKTRLASRYASPSSSNITYAAQPSSNSAGFTISVSATNPFCSTAVTRPIYAQLSLFLTRSGNYAMTGQIRQYPSHLVSLRTSLTANFTPILSVQQTSVTCLNSLLSDCLTPAINIAGTYN